MPDLRQALRDFVATSNSGKYSDEETLMSKFPELKGYDIQVLRDFVATSNSGKYATEDELFSKFPEFNQKAPLKKKFALESSSEDGSLASQKSTKKPPVKMAEFTEEGFAQAMKKTKEVPTDMSGTPLLKVEDVRKVKPFLKRVEKEAKATNIERKRLGDMFDKQLGIKPKVEDSEYLKERLGSINTELINKTEEYVVPELEYQFGDLGFKFEKSGLMGDYVKVTSPDNKKTIEISLDNLFSSKSKEQSNVLKKFIKENTPAKGLFVLENSLKQKDKKFNSEKEVEIATKKISDDLNALNARQKQTIKDRDNLEKQYKELSRTPENQRGTKEFSDKLALLEQQKAKIDADVKEILKEEEKFKFRSSQLQRAVAKYTLTKSKQGGMFGAIQDAFFGGGIGSMSSGITNAVIDISTEINPAGYGMAPEDLKEISVNIAKKIGVKPPALGQTIEQWKATLTEDQLDEWEDEVDDYTKKDLKSKTLPYIRIGAEEIFGDPETTKQWSDLNKSEFWTGAVLGVVSSLPAMIGGAGPAGWAQRTAQMYAQVSDGLAQEMENDPKFKNISENEKLAITLPIGITGAVLEEFGLKNIKGSTGLINSLTLKALGKAGKGVTAKTFRELVENEVESAIARGTLTITAAGAAEFETGAAQELTETGFKALYNEIKGKEMFETPESTMDLLENVVIAGAQEAVGGFVLGVPTGVSVAYSKKGFLKMDDLTFETFANMANDEKMQSAYIASLKNKITNGEITTQQAKDQLNNYRNSVGLFRQLPDGLTTQQKKEAMNLLKERRDLENYIEGKDAALVVRQKNRINEINDLLTKLSEENAVQIESTAAIPVQSETGVSETMEGGTPETKPEVVTEQVTQEEVNPLIDVESTATALGNAYYEERKYNEYKNIKKIAGLEDAFSFTQISEAYHKAKQDNSNPELVEAVESLLAPKVAEQVTQEEAANPLRDVESTNKALLSEDVSNENYNSFINKYIDVFNEILGSNADIQTKDVSEIYHKAKQDGSNPEFVKAVEELLAPTVAKQTAQEQTTEPTITISEAMQNPSDVFVYDGKKGQLTTIGQTVVLETPTEIIDLGNIDELSETTLADFGIQKEEELNIVLNEDNSVELNGTKYINNYSNPEAAISQDKDGNYSITLETENGQKRTFRGQQADQIVYQMKLKNFEQNGTEQQIEQANELADEAIRVEEQIGTPSTERKGKTVRKGKRKQRTLKTVKEPLTKAEREAQAVSSEEVKTAPSVEDVKPTEIQEKINELEKEKSDILEQLTIYEKFPQPKDELKTKKRLDEINKELETISPKEEIKDSGIETNNFDEIVRVENKSIGGESIQFSFKGSDGNIHKAEISVDDDSGYMGLTQVDGNLVSKFRNEAEDYYIKLKKQKIDSENTDAETKEKLRKGLIKKIENDLETNERNYNQRNEDISVEFFESLEGGSLTRKQIDAEIEKIPRYKAELKAEYEARKSELEKQLEEVKGKKEITKVETKVDT